jgi:hypothetical protein
MSNVEHGVSLTCSGWGSCASVQARCGSCRRIAPRRRARRRGCVRCCRCVWRRHVWCGCHGRRTIVLRTSTPHSHKTQDPSALAALAELFDSVTLAVHLPYRHMHAWCEERIHASRQTHMMCLIEHVVVVVHGCGRMHGCVRRMGRGKRRAVVCGCHARVQRGLTGVQGCTGAVRTPAVTFVVL